MNRWKIPAHVEEIVLHRDKKCVYCRVAFKKYVRATGRRIAIATWEHIDNNVRNKKADNIALCCGACNSSKGNKPSQIGSPLNTANKKTLPREPSPPSSGTGFENASPGRSSQGAPPTVGRVGRRRFRNFRTQPAP